jgi:hypothetical protein
MKDLIDFEDFQIRFAMYGIEFLVASSAFFANAVFFLLLLRAKTLHRNLKLVCCNVLFGNVLFIFSRCLLLSLACL